MHLTIKSHESGLGLYLANKPWRFYKSGDDVAALIIDLLAAGATAAHHAGDLQGKPVVLTDEELARDFG